MALPAQHSFTKGWKRLVAVIAIVLTLISTALRVDMVYGEYTTLGSIFGMGNFPKLEVNKEKSATASIEEWYSLAKQNKLPKMPKKGILRSAHIPNTYSKFKRLFASCSACKASTKASSYGYASRTAR